MLEKVGFEKHRLFFIIIPIFLVKFLIVRFFLFGHIHILETIWVEVFYLIFIFILIEWIQNERAKYITYIVINTVMSILLIGLVLYFKYSGQVVSILMLSQLNQVGTVKASVFKLLNPIYLVLLVDLIAYAIWKWSTKRPIQPIKQQRKPIFLTVMLILSVAMIALSIFTNKNQLITNAAYVAEKEGIFTFEALTIIQKFTHPPEITKKPPEIQSQITRLKGLKQPAVTQYSGALEGKNVIFIQLEAFQDFLINLEVEGHEVTPFLNKLVDNSFYFPNIYQQIAAGSTSDAEFMSNTSLYPNATEATTKEFGDRAIPSFPKLLQKEGYHTLTMHANEVSFWNRENLYPALGFNEWYDSTYFIDEDKEAGKEVEMVGIGLSDRAFLTKSYDVLHKLHEQQTPFYAQLITLTSHHPFVMPDEYKVLPLSEQYDNSIVGDYLQVAHYVDAQLHMFFNLLQEGGILDDTVVVLYGDHQGLQVKNLNLEDKALLDGILGHEYSFLDQYNIPFFIHTTEKFAQDTQKPLQGTIEQVGGQIDMMPTVANLIGLSLDNYVHFGQDLLNCEDNLFGMRYYMPYGSFFTNDVVYMTQSSYEDGIGYDLNTREEIAQPDLYNEYSRVMDLLLLNDQYLNSLPERTEE